jgi:hypothetical protein
MRRLLRVFVAVAICLPVGFISASAAGAANTVVPKCKSFSGIQTYTPGLPPTSQPAKLVNPVSKTFGVLTQCTGGGITKGTVTGTSKAAKGTNCTKLLADVQAGKPGAPIKTTVKWSNGQTSTNSSVLTVTGVNGSSIKAKLVSKTIAGLGKGRTTMIDVLATPNAGWCNLKPLNKVTFTSTKITAK